MRIWSYLLLIILCRLVMPATVLAVGIPQEYPAVVTRVLDGDTVEVEPEVYRLGPRVFRVTERLRLDGIQAPELRGPDCEAERQAGERARDWLHALIEGERVRVLIIGPDKYGRARGDLVLASGQRATQALLDAGHAKPWGGANRDKPDFCS